MNRRIAGLVAALIAAPACTAAQNAGEAPPSREARVFMRSLEALREWPHEPAGHAPTISVSSFDSRRIAPQRAGAWLYSEGWNGSGVSIVDGAVRWTWPAGRSGGSSPGRAVIERCSGLETSSLYIGAEVRWSRDWTPHSTGYDKMFYWGELHARATGAPLNQFMLHKSGDFLQVTLQYAQSYPGQPGGRDSQRRIPSGRAGEDWINMTRITHGEWHLVEVLADGSTNGRPNGRVRVWLDGVLQFDVDNVRWTPSGDTRFCPGINADPVWGGVGGRKPHQDFFEIRRLRVSGR